MQQPANRRDPFSDVGVVNVPREPMMAVALGHTALPTALDCRGGTRKSRVSPSEKRRKERMLTITFSDSAIVERLRAIAVERGWYTMAGQPNVSKVAEEYIAAGLVGEK